VKQEGYWSDDSRLAVRSVLSHPCPLFPRSNKNRTTCMHIVSFLSHIPFPLWSFKRWRIDPSDCIPSPISCLSALAFSLYPSIIPSPIEICPSTRWEWNGGSVHTLSRLIGPIVTSHFLWWSNGQLPSLCFPPPLWLKSFSHKSYQTIYRSLQKTHRSGINLLILPSNHLIQRRWRWEFYPST
jgi:hypothetical protein